MSWSTYRDVKRKVGSFLRVRQLPAAIAAVAPADHRIQWVKVESRSKGRAILEIWSHRLGEVGLRSICIEDGTPNRYTVTVVSVLEDPSWIVEGK